MYMYVFRVAEGLTGLTLRSVSIDGPIISMSYNYTYHINYYGYVYTECYCEADHYFCNVLK